MVYVGNFKIANLENISSYYLDFTWRAMISSHDSIGRSNQSDGANSYTFLVMFSKVGVMEKT